MAWLARVRPLPCYFRYSPNRHFEGSPCLSWLWYLRTRRWSREISGTFNWVCTLLIRLFSSMSYPIGINHLMKSLKYATLLNLGQININEYRELTTFSFTDFIYSKYQVILTLCRLSHTVTCAFTISLLIASFIGSTISIIEVKTISAGHCTLWKWRRLLESRKTEWSRENIEQLTSWGHCRRVCSMKISLWLQVIKPLRFHWTKETWSPLHKELIIQQNKDNDFFYLWFSIIGDFNIVTS